MARELEKVYDPKAVEGRIYDLWRAKKSFSARPDPAKSPSAS